MLYHKERRHRQRKTRKPKDVNSTGKKGTYCKLCDAKFQDHILFRNHCNGYHLKERHLFKLKSELLNFDLDCGFCSKKFPSELSLKYHTNQTHDIIKVLDLQQSCRLCLVRFKSTKMLKIHLFKYHLLELGLQNQDVKALELKEQCLQCDKKYLTQRSYSKDS